MLACATPRPTLRPDPPTAPPEPVAPESPTIPLVLTRAATNVTTPAPSFRIVPPVGMVSASALSPDGRTAVGCDSSGHVVVTDATSGSVRALRRVGGSIQDMCNRVSFDRSGTRVLLGFSSGPRRAWDLVEDRWRVLSASERPEFYGPDDDQLLYVTQRNDACFLHVHDLADDTIRELPGTPGCWAPFALPEGGWLTRGEDRTLSRHDAEGAALWTVPFELGNAIADDAIAVRPGGRFVALASEGDVRVLRVEDGVEVAKHVTSGRPTLRWSSNGATLWWSVPIEDGQEASALDVESWSLLGGVAFGEMDAWVPFGSTVYILHERLESFDVRTQHHEVLFELGEPAFLAARPRLSVDGKTLAFSWLGNLRTAHLPTRRGAALGGEEGALVQPTRVDVVGSSLVVSHHQGAVRWSDDALVSLECGELVGLLASGEVVGRRGICGAPPLPESERVIGLTHDRTELLVLEGAQIGVRDVHGRNGRWVPIDPAWIPGCPGEACRLPRVARFGDTTWVLPPANGGSLLSAMFGGGTDGDPRALQRAISSALPTLVRLDRRGRATPAVEGVLVLDFAGPHVLATGTFGVLVLDGRTGDVVHRSEVPAEARLSPDGRVLVSKPGHPHPASMVRLPNETMWTADVGRWSRFEAHDDGGVYVLMPDHTELWTWSGERLRLPKWGRATGTPERRAVCDGDVLTLNVAGRETSLGRCAFTDELAFLDEDRLVLRTRDAVELVSLTDGSRSRMSAAVVGGRAHALATREGRTLSTEGAAELLVRPTSSAGAVPARGNVPPILASTVVPATPDTRIRRRDRAIR